MTASVTGHTNTTATPGSTAYAANLPASIAAGELLLVWIITSSEAVTAIPSGWSQVAGASNTSTAAYINCYSKTATGSEGASATWTTAFASQTVALAARIASWGAIEATHTATGYGNAPADSVTTVSANALVVGVAALIPDHGTATSTPPGSWTEYEDVVAATNYRQGSLNSIVKATAGAQSGTWALSDTGLWVTSLLSISAAAAAAQTTSGRLSLGLVGKGDLTVVQVTPPPATSQRVLTGALAVNDFRNTSLTVIGGA